MGGLDFVKATGNLAEILVAANVFDFLKSRYFLAALVVSNTSSATFEIPYSSLDMLCRSRNAESRLAPFEPEALVARFSKERSSLDASRGWGRPSWPWRRRTTTPDQRSEQTIRLKKVPS